MRIAFVDVVGSPYDGSTPSKRGLGGSESAVVYAARELQKIGFEVHVYNDSEGLDARPGDYDGVSYRPVGSLGNDRLGYDVVIVSRSTGPFKHPTVAATPFRVLWMHDTFCDGDEDLEFYTTSGLISEIWTLSDWHTTYISQCTHGHRRMMEVLKRKIWVTRNGVNLHEEADLRRKEKNNFVFNAAVSKGMVTLLEDVWPKVKERIPLAELTIIGGAYPLKNADVQNDALRDLTAKHHGQNGVHFTGMITQSLVAHYMSQAAFMIYPQSFPETFGISTVEALAYGTPVISGRFGAMEETAIDQACYLMDYPVDSNVLYTFNKEAHVEAFVNLVVEAYNNDYLWQQKCNLALKVREVCTWDKVALQWKQHLYKVTGRYLPVDQYRDVQRINHRTHEIFNKRWSNPEEWAYYPENERSLVVVVPFYNASQYLRKCIESIAAQNYSNYQVYLVDDASTDDSRQVAAKALDEVCGRRKWKFYLNSNYNNKGALANQIEYIDERFDESWLREPIVVLIDGDDALANDPNIFKKINAEYENGAKMTYGSMWSVADNIPLVAQEYPNEVFEEKSFRSHRFNWNIPYTHLRTFSLDLYRRIDRSDLRDSSGAYFKAGGDSALFYALIEQCGDRSEVRAIRDILYLYNDTNPINDYKVNSEEQTKNANEVLSRAKRFVSDGKGVTIIKGDGKGEPVLTGRSKKRVLIAIPTAQNIHPETFKSIYDQQIPEELEVDFQFFFGYCVDQVRNLIADYTIRNNYDYLFCVDYDMEFPPNTLKKLFDAKVDFVTGVYIQRKPGQHILEIYRKDDNGFDYNVPIGDLPEYMLHAVSGCGLGCALIKTEVLKEVGYPQFTYHHAIRMEDTVSEDIDFCNKVRNTGRVIWVDSSIKCRHHGKSVFEV